MRAYYFGNFYLSSIQQGIQAAHVNHDLFVKYLDEHLGDTSQNIMMWDWAENHKTMILLNGGMASDLLRIETMFKGSHNPYAWTSFREEKAALNNSITSVGIVLPECIYEGASIIRANRITIEEFSKNPTLDIQLSNNSAEEHVSYTKFDTKLMFMMNQHGLAR